MEDFLKVPLHLQWQWNKSQVINIVADIYIAMFEAKWEELFLSSLFSYF